MEVTGSEDSAEVKFANPHPTLSLGKGEANQAPMQNNETLNALR